MRKAVLFLTLFAAACAARTPVRLNPAWYEAYYDGAYGPFRDGYWGRDARYFWYLDKTGVWRRDDRHHFQRGDGGGAKWTPVRGTGVQRVH
jgi:hypothetical protein